MIKIHPHVEKFVDAQTRNIIRFESVSSQVFLSDIEVAFEWRYAPAEWSIGDHRTAAAKFYAYVFQLPDSRNIKSMVIVTLRFLMLNTDR